ncbi:MAG: bifunctional diguanylate cyclase/phosphodiesterase, partial [Gemmatimonadaceae bacterium]
DTVARLGGDEFAVLIASIASEKDAIVIAERISRAMARPFALEGGDVVAGVSIGIARGRDGQGVDDLLRNADVAMYVAKRGGRGRHAVFEQEMQTEVLERLVLEADLRAGIERGELRLVYQPLIELESGRMTGVEALVRWQHPERGLLTPDVFISIAEDSGLIKPLGRWVLAEAARQGAEWLLMSEHFALAVSVNISGRQLQDPTFADEVATVLLASGFPAENLFLEITESEIMRNTEATLARLHALKALGIRLAIDDFGTGYSSLSYLQRFPIDMLKIDKCFVDDVARVGNGQSLARMIVALGETLSLMTVAEGVEACEQATALRAMGCHHAQGYHFSRPVAALAISALLGRGRKSAPIFPLIPVVADAPHAACVIVGGPSSTIVG